MGLEQQGCGCAEGNKKNKWNRILAALVSAPTAVVAANYTVAEQ